MNKKLLLILIAYLININSAQTNYLQINQKFDSLIDQTKAMLQSLASVANKKYKKPEKLLQIKEWIQWHLNQLRTIQINKEKSYTDTQVIHNCNLLNVLVTDITTSLDDNRLNTSKKFSPEQNITRSAKIDSSKIANSLDESFTKLAQANIKICNFNLTELNITCRNIDSVLSKINQRYNLYNITKYSALTALVASTVAYVTPTSFFEKTYLLPLKKLVGEIRTEEEKKAGSSKLSGPRVFEKFSDIIGNINESGSKQFLLGVAAFLAYTLGKSIDFNSITELSNIVTDYTSNKWKKMQGFTAEFNPENNYETPTINLNDKKIILNKEQKAQLEKIARCIAEPEIYGEFTPKNIILVGDSGCGKTEFARALCGSIQEIINKNEGTRKFKFKEVSPSEILFSQDGLKQVIKDAQANGPIILFFDEFHLMGASKPDNVQSGVWGANILAGLLTAISGVNTKNDPKSQVILVAATNRHDLIDPALKRSGRFGDLVIHCTKPEFEDRKRFFEIKLEDNGIDLQDINLDKLASQTKDCSFSDLADIIKNARSIARLSSSSITQEHILQSIYEKIYNICKDNNLAEYKKRIIATHLCGQAIIHDALKLDSKIYMITINGIWKKISEDSSAKEAISWGKIFIHDKYDNLNILTNNQKIARAKMLLAGSVAQKILLNDISDYNHTDRIKAKELIEDDNLIKFYQKEVEEILNKNLDKLNKLVSMLLESKSGFITDKEIDAI